MGAASTTASTAGEPTANRMLVKDQTQSVEVIADHSVMRGTAELWLDGKLVCRIVNICVDPADPDQQPGQHP